MRLIYFHRNKDAGFSINKVTQTIVREIEDKEEYYMPSAGAGIKDLFSNILFIIKHRKKGAIHHITGDVHYGLLGLIGYTSVLTIHDTVGLDFVKMNKFKSMLIEWLWFRLPMMIASKVLCISEVTKTYLQKYTSRTDIRVIHNAIDSTLQFSDSKPIEGAAKILFIGVKENKNLLRCFEALKGIDCHVTVIGKLRPEQIKALEDNGINYTNKCSLSDEELNTEYYNCDIVSFCSLFEGFGMPALEGQQAGRPVLCSSLPVLKEVAGDGACFVDPYSVESIRNGYLRLINDEEYRQQLVVRGKINVSNYLSSEIKRQWENVYNELKTEK